MKDMLGKKILVIDDNLEMLQLVVRIFKPTGAQMFTASDGREGMRQMFVHRPDLVLLDLMMPDLDGWTVCQQIRHFSSVPIIMLTVLDRGPDIIRALDSGADYYVTKPFAPKVLLARARAALRRGMSATNGKTPVTYSDEHLTIDVVRQRVYVGGEAVELSATEFRLLAYMLQNDSRVVTFREILEYVWQGLPQEKMEYVHTYMWRLRRKLEQNPGQPEYLLAEHGVGYSFQKQGF
jgi:two-component system KDP operon response regulator KdpE